MLLSVHHPITDFRSFFSDRLGQAVSLEKASSAFIRSVGGRAPRFLGSDDVLKEASFYRVNKSRIVSVNSNRPITISRLKRSFSRYYQFDEAAGRLEITASPKNVGDKVNLLSVLRLVESLSFCPTVNPDDQIFALDCGSPFAKTLQKQNIQHHLADLFSDVTLVRADQPVVFVEALRDELEIGAGAYEASITVPGIRLYSTYVRKNILTWIIVRIDNSHKEDSRLLRKYLSRLHCQIFSHMRLLMKMPWLADAMRDRAPMQVDEYTSYLTSSRRFIRKNDSEIADLYDATFLQAAVGAISQSARLDEDFASKIADMHAAYVRRGNILQNIKDDLRLLSNDRNKVKKNVNVNIFGKQSQVDQTLVEVPACDPSKELLLVSLNKFHELIRVYGSDLSHSQIAAIESIISSIAYHCRQRTVSGPFVMNEINRLKNIAQRVKFGFQEISTSLDELRMTARL